MCTRESLYINIHDRDINLFEKTSSVVCTSNSSVSSDFNSFLNEDALVGDKKLRCGSQLTFSLFMSIL